MKTPRKPAERVPTDTSVKASREATTSRPMRPGRPIDARAPTDPQLPNLPALRSKHPAAEPPVSTRAPKGSVPSQPERADTRYSIVAPRRKKAPVHARGRNS